MQQCCNVWDKRTKEKVDASLFGCWLMLVFCFFVCSSGRHYFSWASFRKPSRPVKKDQFIRSVLTENTVFLFIFN